MVAFDQPYYIGGRGVSRYRELVVSVVAVAGLHGEILLLRGQDDLVVAAVGALAVGRVPERVLAAQFFGDGGVDLVGAFFFAGFEEAASGGGADLLHDFFAVDVGLLLRVLPASSTTAPGISATTGKSYSAAVVSAASAGKSAAGVALFALVVDGVNDGIGTLRCFDGAVQ